MKNSTQKLLKLLPCKPLNEMNSLNLNATEKTLVKLAVFLENPGNNSFDISDLYHYLDNEVLEVALDAINTFFTVDTYKLPKRSHLFVKVDDPFINQTSFASLLTSNGLPFDLKKINVYRSRGLLPNPDITIEGVPYWYRTTALGYIQGKIEGVPKPNIYTTLTIHATCLEVDPYND